MASIDHTVIVFKNGKLLRDHGKSEDGHWHSYIPFDFNRDGIPTSVLKYEHENNLEIQTEHYYHVECDEYTMCVMIKRNFNVVFCATDNDAYVLIGGCGHYDNPYTHFYDRGYGEDFERAMCRECLNWLCGKFLKQAIEIVVTCELYGPPMPYRMWLHDLEQDYEYMKKVYGYDQSNPPIEFVTNDELKVVNVIDDNNTKVTLYDDYRCKKAPTDIVVIKDANSNDIEIDKSELEEISKEMNILRCKAIVVKQLKEMIKDGWYTENLLNDDSLIARMANDYYDHCRALIFVSQYESENNYSSSAIETALKYNATLIQKYAKI